MNNKNQSDKLSKQIMLSFDLEEFDLPLEYNQTISEQKQMSIVLDGAKQVAAMLDELDICATFFTTARFAKAHPKFIVELSKKHEIASHSFNHSSFAIEDLQRSRLALEDIIAKPVYGFRRPRFAPTDNKEIKKAGYTYNSSINPIWLPGRYNNFFANRRAHFDGELLNIPISATPIVRFPLFWLSLKNMPGAIVKPALSWTLKEDNYLNIFFHPWEFTSEINNWELPKLITRRSGAKLTALLKEYLKWLNKRGEFVKMSDFSNSYQQKT